MQLMSNKEIIRRWFEEVWNSGKEETIDELFAADGIAHGLADENDGPIIGPEGYKPLFRNLKDSFPDITVRVEDIIEEGETVAARCVVAGKHAGSNLGIEATQKNVRFTGMTFVKIKDGQIIEAWNNFDFMNMLQQIDAVTTSVKFK